MSYDFIVDFFNLPFRLRRHGDSIKNDRRFMVSALGFEADGFLIKVTAELIVINSENPEVSPEARVFSAKSRDIEARLRRYLPSFKAYAS